MDASHGRQRQMVGFRGEWWASEVNGGHWRQVVVWWLVAAGGKWCAMGLSCGCWRQVVGGRAEWWWPELSDGHQEAIHKGNGI